jgi:hypothetical protein
MTGCLTIQVIFDRKSNPTKTRSVFERSPMIFRIGSGSLRTNVGMAKI